MHAGNAPAHPAVGPAHGSLCFPDDALLNRALLQWIDAAYARRPKGYTVATASVAGPCCGRAQSRFLTCSSGLLSAWSRVPPPMQGGVRHLPELCAPGGAAIHFDHHTCRQRLHELLCWPCMLPPMLCYPRQRCPLSGTSLKRRCVDAAVMAMHALNGCPALLAHHFWPHTSDLQLHLQKPHQIAWGQSDRRKGGGAV